jgi:hypothetical protein
MKYPLELDTVTEEAMPLLLYIQFFFLDMSG